MFEQTKLNLSSTLAKKPIRKNAHKINWVLRIRKQGLGPAVTTEHRIGTGGFGTGSIASSGDVGVSSTPWSCTCKLPGRRCGWSLPLSLLCLLSREMLGRIKPLCFSLRCPGCLWLCFGIVWLLLPHNSEGKQLPSFINSAFLKKSDSFWKDKRYKPRITALGNGIHEWVRSPWTPKFSCPKCLTLTFQCFCGVEVLVLWMAG